jgi:hypothetical protein
VDAAGLGEDINAAALTAVGRLHKDLQDIVSSVQRHRWPALVLCLRWFEMEVLSQGERLD